MVDKFGNKRNILFLEIETEGGRDFDMEVKSSPTHQLKSTRSQDLKYGTNLVYNLPICVWSIGF